MKLSKPIPPDTETYIRKAKLKATPTGETLDKLNEFKDREISETMKQIELIKARKALEEAVRGTGMSANTVVSKMFEGKSVEEINEMLANMTPEAIDNLTRLVNSLENNPVNAVLRPQPQVQPQKPDISDTLLRLLIEQNSKKTDDLISLVRLLKEVQPAPAPVQQPQSSAIEIVKLMQEFNRPYYESLGRKDKEIFDLKMKELEAKMPADPIEQLKYFKEASAALGLGGGKNELDLKLEEMRQNREVDMKRLDWEQHKYEMEQEADVAKWEQIGKILQGPVGDVVKQLGGAGADRVRGGKIVGRVPTPVQTQCPNCKHTIYVDAEADTALCGSCGAVLQKQGGIAPPPPAAPPAPEVDVDELPEEENEEVESTEEEKLEPQPQK